MVSLKIHHIGYLVKKMEAAIIQFTNLGFIITSPQTKDNVRKVHICFMEKDGYRIELVSPYDSTSVVSGLLKKYKNCPYHLCYESAHFEADFATLTENGYFAIDTPTAAPAISDKKVVFLMHPTLGMIELLQV